MISCNSDWKNWLNSGDYTVMITLNNTQSEFVNLDIPFSDIVQNSLVVNRFSVTGSQIEVGSATAAEVQITLDNSVAKARGYLTAMSGGSVVQRTGKDYDDVVLEGARVSFAFKHGSYALYFVIATVDEVTRQGDYIHLVLLDDMVKLDKPVSGTIPTSISSLISAICIAGAFEFASAESHLLNTSVTLATPTSENLTYRQLLQWVCQVTGTCAYMAVINGTAKLVLDWYGGASGTANTDTVNKLVPSNRFSSTIDQQPITITGVSVKVGDTAYESKTNANYVLSIENNELIDETNAQTIATGLASRLNGFSYTPFSAETNGLTWLQPLDMVVFTDKGGTDNDVIITDWTFSPYANVKLEGKGESQTRKGYATNAPFTAEQTRIIEEIKRNQPEVNVDSRLIATLALNEAINNGMMLHSGTYNGKTYYFDYYDEENSVYENLQESTYIVVATTNGIAWTTQGWGDGDTTWEYGITGDGNAIINQLQAYSINADLITAGTIDASDVTITNLNASNITSGAFEVKDGSTTIHKLGTDKSAMIGGANGIVYNASTGKTSIGTDVDIAGNVKIDGSVTIGQAIVNEVASAVSDLDVVGIDHTDIDYQASTSNSTVPSGTWSSTIVSVPAGQYLWTRTTIYYSDHTVSNPHTDVSYSVARQGQNGKGVTTSTSQYAIWKSGDKAPAYNYSSYTTYYYARTSTANTSVYPSNTSLWKTSISAAGFSSSKKYLYACTVYTYADGTTQSFPIVYGELIKTWGESTTIDESTFRIDPWVNETPALSSGRYFWTKTTTNYSDNTSLVTFNVSYTPYDGSSRYVWIRYADAMPQANEDMKTTPSEYIGIYNGTKSSAPTNYGEYTWAKWTGTDGADGEPGTNGTNGTDGRTTYVHFAYGTSSSGANFNKTYFANATYLGIKADFESDDPNDPSVYTWSLMYGANVKYIWYGVSDSPNTAPSYSTTVYNDIVQYMVPGSWLWVTTEYTDGSTASTKSYIGNDGKDGTSVIVSNPIRSGNKVTFTLTDKNGAKPVELFDGEDGDDGNYVHFAWADNLEFDQDPQGSFSHSGFTTNNQAATNKRYIGVCADDSKTDPQVPGEYSWTLIKGADGADGSDGKGITAITSYYYATEYTDSTLPQQTDLSSWKTLPSSTTFSETDRYLWMFTSTSFTSGSPVRTTPSIIGVWGSKGDKGDPGDATGAIQGRSVVSIKPQYTLSTSNSTSNRPTSGWGYDMPPYSNASGGARQYYWQRDEIEYDKALNGTRYEYTQAVLLQGINDVMLQVNELNADFAEVMISESGQTFINGAKIYTGTLTAAAIASNRAFIKSLMSEVVEVDGKQKLYGNNTDSSFYLQYTTTSARDNKIAELCNITVSQLQSARNNGNYQYDIYAMQRYGALDSKFIYYANEAFTYENAYPLEERIPRAAVTDSGFLVADNLSDQTFTRTYGRKYYDRDPENCLSLKYDDAAKETRSSISPSDYNHTAIYSTSARIPYGINTPSIYGMSDYNVVNKITISNNSILFSRTNPVETYPIYFNENASFGGLLKGLETGKITGWNFTSDPEGFYYSQVQTISFTKTYSSAPTVQLTLESSSKYPAIVKLTETPTASSFKCRICTIFNNYLGSYNVHYTVIPT